MEKIRIQFGENQDIELDEIDIGVADDVIAFDVSGRIVGIDESFISKLSGKRLTPTELHLEAQNNNSSTKENK